MFPHNTMRMFKSSKVSIRWMTAWHLKSGCSGWVLDLPKLDLDNVCDNTTMTFTWCQHIVGLDKTNEEKYFYDNVNSVGRGNLPISLTFQRYSKEMLIRRFHNIEIKECLMSGRSTTRTLNTQEILTDLPNLPEQSASLENRWHQVRSDLPLLCLQW